MKASFCAILFLLSFSSSGQKTIIVDTMFYKYADSKLSFFAEHQKFMGDLGLKDLTKTDDFLTLRLTMAGSVFQLTIDTSGHKNYKYLNYSWTFNKKKFKDGELLLKHNELPGDSIERIFQELAYLRVDTLLLTDRRTWEEQWQGNENIIEVSNKKQYKLLTLNQEVEDWTSPLHKLGKEFTVVNDFLLFAQQKIGYRTTLYKFQNALPAGKYCNGFNTFWNYDQ